MMRFGVTRRDSGSLVVEMNNLFRRITLAVVFIPILLVFIFILPQYSHLLLNLLIIALSVIGGLETRHLFSKRNTELNSGLTIVLSAVFPVMTTLVIMGILPNSWILGCFLFFVSLLIIITALSRSKDKIAAALDRLPAYCFILIFPGFFMSYLIRINLFSESSMLFLFFLTFVFGNDSFAYFFGMLLGKATAEFFP